MANVKCLNPGCDQILFETVELDDRGNQAIKTGTSHPTLEYDARTGQPFMRCPSCKKRIGFREAKIAAGAPTQVVLGSVLN